MSAAANKRKTTPQQHWQTPRDLWRAADAEFAFTLDAAASHTNHLCERYYIGPSDVRVGDELAVNALAQKPGRGEVIFCNPPYGNLKRWIEWFAACAQRGATVFAVLPVATPAYFELIWSTASELRLTTQRPQFIHPLGCECKACVAGEVGSSTLDIWFAIWRPGQQYHGWHVRGPNVNVWNYPRDIA